MRPDFRVSIDDRFDFYGDDTVFSFVDLTKGSAGWDEKLKKENYDSLLLDPYLPLNKLLHSLPEWKEVYRDEHVIVYWKD
jgi:response regulator of citrate/malate metabolism